MGAMLFRDLSEGHRRCSGSHNQPDSSVFIASR